MSPEAAIDVHLAFLDEEERSLALRQEREARHVEELAHLVNLVFVLTHFDLKTGALIPCVPTSPNPKP